MTCSSCQDNLLYDSLSILWILLQVVAQSLRQCTINSCRNLVVTQLSLGLALELRLCNLNRYYSCQALTEVITANLELNLRQHTRLICILLQSTSQSTTETGEVSTTLDGVDIIYIRVYILRERIVVLHCNLYRNTVLLGVEVDNLLDNLLTTRLVEVLHKLLQTILRVEALRTWVTLLVLITHIGDCQSNTLVQECQLAQTSRKNLVAVCLSKCKDLSIRLESYGCTAVLAIANNLNL